LLILAVLSLAIAATRFVPSIGVPVDAADFAGGLGVGFLIGVAVIWAGERMPRG
jgi:phosphoribosylcarboxyaminoimidazole (NCAIR) mutase